MFSKIYRTRLFRSASIYTVSRVINSAVPFLLMPVLTRVLEPSEYGLVAIFTILICIVTPFVGLSLHGAVAVKFYELNERELSRFIGNVFMILGLSTLVASGIVYFFSAIIESYTELPADWLWAVVAVALGNFIVRLQLTLWQVEDSPIYFGVFQNVQSLISILVSIYLVVVLGFGWRGYVCAQVMASLSFAALAIAIMKSRREITLVYNKSDFKWATKFGFPLIPHDLGAGMVVQTDRLFLTNMVSVASAGIYTVGYQIGAVVELAAGSFNQAYVPWLFRKLKEGSVTAKRKIVIATYAYFAVITIIALFVGVSAKYLIPLLAGENYHAASEITPWIAIGFAFSGMYYMVVNYVFFVGKTVILSIVTFTTAIINVLLNYVFIKMNGPVGAAQATACALLISFLLTWYLSSRVYDMPWRLKVQPAALKDGVEG